MGASGGTIASALNTIGATSIKEFRAVLKPFSISPITPTHFTPQKSVLYDDKLGGWIGPWLMSKINAAVVCRTYGLLGGRWGDKFSYKEYLTRSNWIKCYIAMAVLEIASAILAIPPVRWLVSKFVLKPGDGPSDETMKNGKITMKIIAETEGENGIGSITVSAEGDPAYLMTGMICGR